MINSADIFPPYACAWSINCSLYSGTRYPLLLSVRSGLKCVSLDSPDGGQNTFRSNVRWFVAIFFKQHDF